MPTVACRVLGPVEVTVGGEPAPPELLWRKHLALLVYLAMSPKQSRARGHLTALLWGDKQEQAARHSLNEALRVLRRSGGDDFVATNGDRVHLTQERIVTDISEFERLEAAEAWQNADALIRGEFLEGVEIPGCPDFDAWLSTERAGWRKRKGVALLAKAEAMARGGDLSGAAGTAETALTLDPLSEQGIGSLMRSLALSGDRNGALSRYRDFKARLQEELAIAPSVEIETLAERIRADRVTVEPPEDRTPEDDGLRRAPLIGRAEELAVLLDSWHDAVAGAGAGAGSALLVIDGDGGSGKSRLLQEFSSRAQLHGATVVGFRAVEGDRIAPLGGIANLARDALLAAPGIVGANSAALSAFTARIPEWADRFPDLEYHGEPMALPAALTDVCRAIAAEGPLLVAIDDIHWLDEASLAGLLSLLRDLRDQPFVLAVTTSPTLAQEPLERARASVGRDLHGTAVTLGPWRVDDLGRMVRWSFPDYSPQDTDRLVRRLASDTGGLPFLVIEILDAITLGLDLTEQSSAWPREFRTLETTLPGDLPDAVRSAIRMGYRKLTRESQLLLAAIASLGDRVTVDELAAAAELDRLEVTAHLDALEWQRWVSSDAMGYSFVARIARRIVAEDMVTSGQRERFAAVRKAQDTP
jgi:DNA-binding SARP family transcriptional activator